MYQRLPFTVHTANFRSSPNMLFRFQSKFSSGASYNSTSWSPSLSSSSANWGMSWRREMNLYAFDMCYASMPSCKTHRVELLSLIFAQCRQKRWRNNFTLITLSWKKVIYHLVVQKTDDISICLKLPWGLSSSRLFSLVGSCRSNYQSILSQFWAGGRSCIGFVLLLISSRISN